VVEEICRGWEPSGERAFFEAYTARVRLMVGDAAAARRWASERVPSERSETLSYFREIELLTLARVAVLNVSESMDDTRLAETLALLGWLREHAVAGGRGAVVMETLALEAHTSARKGEEVQMHTSGLATRSHTPRQRPLLASLSAWARDWPIYLHRIWPDDRPMILSGPTSCSSYARLRSASQSKRHRLRQSSLRSVL
jgi:hypothetical protein